MGSFKGCGTALVTPFNEDGSVDYVSYGSLVRRQVEAEVDFLVALGTTAEVSCLTGEEKQSLVALTLELAGRVPVIVGVGSNDTQKVVEEIKVFERSACCGFLVVTPYYNRPNQQGLEKHYREVASVTDKAIVLYNIPGRTGVNLNSETVLRLATLDNIVGIKEASSNYTQISEIIRLAPQDFKVFSGNDHETLAMMATGASGVISAVANLAPTAVRQLTACLLEERWREARDLHYRLSDLFSSCFIDTNPQPIKGALSRLGLIRNVLRSPLIPTKEANIDLVMQALKKVYE